MMRNEFDLTPQPPSQTKTLLIILGSCLGVFICLACGGAAAVVGWVAWDVYTEQQAAVPTPTSALVITIFDPTATPRFKPSPTPEPGGKPPESQDAATSASPTALPSPSLNLAVPEAIDQSPVADRALADLELLFTTSYPYYDYYEVTKRLSHNDPGPRTITGRQYQVGDQQSFYADEISLEATLAAVTDHAYFWVENGLDVEQTAVLAAAQQFEDEYYPLLANLFGDVWTPGIDNDPHFSLMHMAGSIESDELGYFTDINQYPNTIYSNSNQQEMIYLNMAQLTLGSDLYYGTLVHEVQHLIQWNMDANETAWLDEGLAQLAELYVGLDTSTTEEYTNQPHIQLNTWPYEEDHAIDAHYAGAYLFLVYLWEQLGEKAIQELSRHPANGIVAVRSVLQGYAPERELAHFMADWAVANYLDDPGAGTPYAYERLEVERPSSQVHLSDIPFDTINELNQFGTHYIDLDFKGEVNLTFAGDTILPLMEAPPRSNEPVWFAPPVNDTDAQLTAVFDLTDLDTATLRFNAWYDLEEDWDFAYVAISTDEGLSWDLLSPLHARSGEYGPAFNHQSATEQDAVNGWVKESISLNSYVGRSVLIRFEVLTDSAVLGRGLALNEITIPELGQRPITWQADGFIQTGWQLPQQWQLRLIKKGDRTHPPQVMTLDLDSWNQGQWLINVGQNGSVLVITPLTPFSEQTATYWLHIQK